MKNPFPLAQFPEIHHPLWRFVAAPVVLQKGNQNWGAVHIERSHVKELKGQSTHAFVADIVKTGTPIFCEFEGMGKDQKVLVVNTHKGTAVLVYKETKQGSFYTVITAFARKQTKGELIGKLR
jgi:hypothetical protein